MQTILVADDNATNRQYLNAVLVPHGYQVLEAEDGSEALEVCRSAGPDLVICDVLMPVMDGYEVLRRLRESPMTADIPVIFYTAYYLDGESRELATAGGVHRVLAKPCEPETLLDTAQQALADTPRPGGLAASEDFRQRHLRLVSDRLARSAQENEEINQRLAGLIELNLQLASQRDPEQLLSTVCHGARELARADHSILAVKDRECGTFTYTATSGIGFPLTDIESDTGLLQRVREDRVPERTHGEGLDPEALGLPPGYPPFTALLAVPITSLKHSFGWLCLTSRSGRQRYSSEEEMLLSILGAQTGRIYENGTLYKRISHHATLLEQEISQHEHTQQHLQTQFAVSQVLATTAALGQIGTDLLQVIGENLDFAVCGLWNMDSDSDTFQLLDIWAADASEHNALRQVTQGGANLAVPGSALENVVTRGKAVWIEDFSREPRLQEATPMVRHLFREHGWRNSVMVPILLRGQVKGLLSLAGKEAAPRNDALLHTLTAIGYQIGQFLEIRHQQDSIAKLSRLYTVRSGINNAVVRVRERERLFQACCNIALDQGRFRLAWMASYDAGGRLQGKPVFACAESLRGSAETLVDTLLTGRADPAIQQVLDSGKPLVDNRLSRNQREHPPIPFAGQPLIQGCHSAAVFPVLGRGENGSVIVLYADEFEFFDEQEILLLDEIAADIAFAVHYLQYEEQLNRQAYRDTLTGLINRSALYATLNDLTEAGPDSPQMIALVLANINNFHDINEALGHNNGDNLLCQVAQRLDHCAWETEIVACLGGDDFAVVLPAVSNRSQITRLVERILNASQDSFMVSGIPVNVEMTVGVAVFPDDGSGADLLWQRADIALQQARQRFQTHLYYTPEIDHSNPRQIVLIGELRNAIDSDELVLYYQPKIDMKTGAVTGVEALVRWDSPRHGLVFPDQFIPAAEQTGLINPLTHWVLRKGLAQVTQWNRNGYDLDLSVNISVRNLQNPALSDDLLSEVRQHGWPLHKLMLEVTESAIMSDPVNAQSVLSKLSNAGIKISLDDFGIGQSSLTYLKDLPVSRLKIDKSFVFGLSEPSNSAIVSGVVAIAHQLGLTVTAEGVEDLATFEHLRQFGCDFAQGYYFSKPLPPAAFIEWLAQYSQGSARA